MIALTNARIATPVHRFDPGALIVDGAHLAHVGPEAELDNEIANCDTVIDLQGRLVLPGFVDAHTHLIFGGDRVGEFGMRCSGATYEQIAASGGGIRSTIAATRGFSEDELFQIGRRHAAWMLSNGTTTAEAKSGYGMDLETELKLLNAIRRVGETTALRTIPTFLGLHAVPDGRGKAEFVREVIEVMLPAAAPHATYVDAFIEERYFGHDDARRLADGARHHGLGIRLHVDQLTNNGGAKLAAELGADTADHLEQTDEEGIEALAEAGVIPVLLPASVHCLGKKQYPDAKRMIEAGLPVVLATDLNPGSSPTPSLPFVMNLACTQMGMTPTQAIEACTLNAARSLGLESEIGSLEKGKRADFTVWDAYEPEEIAYWVGAPLLHSVYAGGVRWGK